MNGAQTVTQNLMGTFSNIFKLSYLKSCEWTGHAVRVLQQEIQQNRAVDMGVIATINILFFSIMIKPLLNILEKHLENQNSPRLSGQNIFILTNSIAGFSVLGFNLLLSKATKYRLSYPFLAAITAIAIATNVLINQLKTKNEEVGKKLDGKSNDEKQDIKQNESKKEEKLEQKIEETEETKSAKKADETNEGADKIANEVKETVKKKEVKRAEPTQEVLEDEEVKNSSETEKNTQVKDEEGAGTTDEAKSAKTATDMDIRDSETEEGSKKDGLFTRNFKVIPSDDRTKKMAVYVLTSADAQKKGITGDVLTSVEKAIKDLIIEKGLMSAEETEKLTLLNVKAETKEPEEAQTAKGCDELGEAQTAKGTDELGEDDLLIDDDDLDAQETEAKDEEEKTETSEEKVSEKPLVVSTRTQGTATDSAKGALVRSLFEGSRIILVDDGILNRISQNFFNSILYLPLDLPKTRVLALPAPNKEGKQQPI
jgi:hypothetical protein